MNKHKSLETTLGRAYQFYLLPQGRKAPNKKTMPHIRQQLLPSDNYAIVSKLQVTSPFRLTHKRDFPIVLPIRSDLFMRQAKPTRTRF